MYPLCTCTGTRNIGAKNLVPLEHMVKNEQNVTFQYHIDHEKNSIMNLSKYIKLKNLINCILCPQN